MQWKEYVRLLVPLFLSCQYFTLLYLIILQVAATCYTKLNLCLLAIEQRKYEGGDIFINPKNKVINPNAIGKVIRSIFVYSSEFLATTTA